MDDLARIIKKLAAGLPESQEDLSAHPFTVVLALGHYRQYRLLNYYPTRADGPRVGGVAINHFRKTIVVSPRATPAALAKAFLAMFHFEALQQIGADVRPANEPYIYIEDRAKLYFCGNGLKGWDDCDIDTSFVPRFENGQLIQQGAWHDSEGAWSKIRITPWAKPAEIGKAILDAIAHHDPSHRRWLSRFNPAISDPRPRFFIPQNMGA